jgi:ribosomal protein S27E
MKIKCPHCNKADCVNEKAYRNAEVYGSNTFHLPCIYCGKMIQVTLVRKVELKAICKSYRKVSDF